MSDSQERTRHIPNAILRHVNAEGVSLAELERITGIKRGYFSRLTIGTSFCGRRAFTKIEPFVYFDEACREELERNCFIANAARQVRRRSDDPRDRRQPWPETVRKLIAQRPAYNFPIPPEDCAA